MYCSQCSYQLPQDAQFCLRCGTRMVPSDAPSRTYYCVQCGAPYEASFKFCNRCGHAVIPHPQEPIETAQLPEPDTLAAVVPEAHEAEFMPSLPPAVHYAPAVVPDRETLAAVTGEPDPSPAFPEVVGAPSPEPDSSTAIPLAEAALSTEAASSLRCEPPVVRFVLLAMGIIGALSVIAFAAADNLTRARLSVWIPLLAAVCALPFLLYHAGKTRATLKRLAVADEAVGQAEKRLLRQSIVFALLFPITASIVGYAVGASGSETQRLLADMKQYTNIAERIGEQRNSAARTVRGQIAMYDKLETDVRAYAAICTTLHGELTVYDGKYPTQHQGTETELHNVDNEAKRSDLLLKEIEVARRLRSLDDAQQWTVWQSDMQPLLDQEKALD